MKLEIHPQATETYNAKGEALVARLQPMLEQFRHKGGERNQNIHTVHQFTPQNVGEMEFGWTDFTGNVVAKAFVTASGTVGLFEDDHTELARLAEGMQKSIIPAML